MPNDTDLLYSAEVAKLLKVDVRTVHRMAHDGRLQPAARGQGIRGSLVFHRADVDAFAAEQLGETA